MDTALLIGEYLKDKHELLTENDSFNLVEGSIHRWDFQNIPAPTQEELEALIPAMEIKKSQEQMNAEALKFLQESDFKIIRHLDQQNLGISTSLTAEEFQELLHLRQMAREAIIK